jgi:uncharacterized protein (TIGR00156 family)
MSAIRTLIAVSSLVIAVPVLAADAGTPASTAAAVTSAAPVATPAVTVTSIGDVRRGSMVTVEGTVERILDTDEFRLADATGRIRVDVGYPNFVPVAEGERVRVSGFVDRDVFKEIYAREIVHADGRVTRLDRRGSE